MLEQESRDHVFDVWLRRFKAPPMIGVYDFGCALAEYLLSRQPLYFMYTKIVIDRLHWANHKTCPTTLWIGTYPALNDLNSQCAE